MKMMSRKWPATATTEHNTLIIGYIHILRRFTLFDTIQRGVQGRKYMGRNMNTTEQDGGFGKRPAGSWRISQLLFSALYYTVFY